MKLTNKEKNAIQRILSFESEEQDEHTTRFAGDAIYSCTSTTLHAGNEHSAELESKLNLVEFEMPTKLISKKGNSYDVVDGRKRTIAKKVLKVCVKGTKVILAIACDVGQSVNSAIVPKPIDTIVQALIHSVQKHVLKQCEQVEADVVRVVDLNVDEQLQSALDQLRTKGYIIKDAQEVAEAIEEINQVPETELSVQGATSCASNKHEFTSFPCEM